MSNDDGCFDRISISVHDKNAQSLKGRGLGDK